MPTTSSIIPDSYTGTDYAKVQAAINDAIAQRKGVEFDRIYDITGSTITINKTVANRLPMRLFSNSNGGIRKYDGGYIFIATNMNTGDIFVEGITFESQPGMGTIVYKSPNIIRVQSNHCSYLHVDSIVKTADRGYMQSYRFTDETITGGKGYAFDFGGAYDCSWTNVVVEQREHGIIHRGSGTDPDIYGCRIRDCILEGLSGTAIQVRNCTNLVIDGCYFEANKGGHIIINSQSTKSITVSNCRHGGKDVDALIDWNGMIKGFSYNNTAQHIAIHDTRDLSSGSEITSINDITQYNLSAVPDPSIIEGSIPIYRMSPIQSIVTPINDLEVQYGPLRKASETLTSMTLAPLEIKKLSFTFPYDIALDDLLSVQIYVLNNRNVNVCNYSRDAVNKKLVYATLQNLDSVTATVASIKMTTLRLAPFTL